MFLRVKTYLHKLTDMSLLDDNTATTRTQCKAVKLKALVLCLGRQKRF